MKRTEYYKNILSEYKEKYLLDKHENFFSEEKTQAK